MADLFDVSLVAAALRMAVPLLLAGSGGLLCAQAGVFNVALEGKMLLGALGAVAGAHLWGTWQAGLVAAVLAGLAGAGVFALFALGLGGHPVTVGIALNILAEGLTAVLMGALFGGRAFFVLHSVSLLPTYGLGAWLPGPVAPLLSGQNLLYHAAFWGILLVHLFLYHTPWGLRLRAAGLHPLAAGAAGVNPLPYQYGAVLVSGVLCGLAGAWLSLGSLGMFTEGMSAGRGFLALGAVLFGQAVPGRVLAGTLIFGLAEALAIRWQGLGVASQVVLMVPYAATVVSLWLAARLSRRAGAKA